METPATTVVGSGTAVGDVFKVKDSEADPLKPMVKLAAVLAKAPVVSTTVPVPLKSAMPPESKVSVRVAKLNSNRLTGLVPEVPLPLSGAEKTKKSETFSNVGDEEEVEMPESVSE